MECFPLFTSPFPGDGYDASILYARRVCSLSNEEKSYFCRDSDLPSYRFKCLLRAACFSYDVDEQNMCGDMCKRTVARYFIGLGFFRPDYEIMSIVCRAYAVKNTSRCVDLGT